MPIGSTAAPADALFALGQNRSALVGQTPQRAGSLHQGNPVGNNAVNSFLAPTAQPGADVDFWVVFEGAVQAELKQRRCKAGKADGIHIGRLKPGGAAERSGKIQSGDLVVMVAGTPCLKMDIDSLIDIVKQSPRPLRIDFRRTTEVESKTAKPAVDIVAGGAEGSLGLYSVTFHAKPLGCVFRPRPEATGVYVFNVKPGLCRRVV